MFPLTRDTRTIPLADLDRLFEDFFGKVSPPSLDFAPAIEIAEADDAFTVRVEVPGVAPEDVQVSVEDDVLSVRGEKKGDHEDRDGRLHRSERRFGKFSRSVQFPSAVDADKVTASHKNGVLTIRMPKHAKARVRQIRVESE